MATPLSEANCQVNTVSAQNADTNPLNTTRSDKVPLMPIDAVSGIAAALGIGALIAYDLGTGAFVAPKWLFLGAMCAWVLAVSAVAIWRTSSFRVDIVDSLVALFLGYAWLSLAWSSDPLSGLGSAISLTVAAVLFVAVKRADRAQLAVLVPVALTLAVAVVLARAVLVPSIVGGFGNENRTTEFLLLSAPFVAALAANRQAWVRWFAISLVLAAAVYLFAFNDSKLELVAAAALGVWFLGRRWIGRGGWRTASLGAAIGMVLLMAGGVALWRFGVDASIAVRLEIGTNTVLLWLEKPWFGHGLGSYAREYARHQESHTTLLPALLQTNLFEAFRIVDRAHNEYLQVLAELGVAGFAAAATLLAVVVKGHVNKSDPTPLDHAATGCLVMVAAVALVDFPLQNPSTALIATVALGLAANDETGKRRTPTWIHLNAPSRGVRVGGSALCVALALACVLAGVSESVAARHYTQMQHQLATDPARAFALNRLACRVYPPERRYRRQLFITLVSWLEKTGRRPVNRETSDEAFAISQGAAAHEPALILARARYLMLTGTGSAEDIEPCSPRPRTSAPA